MNVAHLPGMQRLLEVMAKLRDPETGCPWDRAQTPGSIAPWTIEEACEVAEAAEAGDVGHWREELGDLLFHVVFHARMAEEAGTFDFDTVAGEVADKLEKRHPHVFGDEDVPSKSDLNLQWEQRKSIGRNHVDEHLPAQLPALMRAYKLQKRAAAVGFDWPDAAGPREKITEELGEIAQAVSNRSSSKGDMPTEEIMEEVGDLLFAVVNYARHLGVDPEQALRASNRKFVRRFKYIESRIAEDGVTSGGIDLGYLDDLWEEAKRSEKKS